MSRTTHAFGSGGLLAAGAVCLTMIGGFVSPAWAKAHADGPSLGSAVVGGFALGDGLEGMIGERDGSFSLELPVGGLRLRWDSRSPDDIYGLGEHFGWALGRISKRGGVQVFPASGGVFTPDPTDRSGLAGYAVGDLVFRQDEGELAPRDPAVATASAVGRAVAAPRAYGYTLSELGGTVTWYSPAGDPIVQIDAFGLRTDWVWDELVPGRLLGVVSPQGVVTDLDWTSLPGSVLVRPGANIEPSAPDELPDRAAGATWTIELDGGRVAAVIDPADGRVAFSFAEHDLLEQVTGVSGGSTTVAWNVGDDRIPRVSRVRTADASGVQLSVRDWAPAGGGTLPSGWPEYNGEPELFWSADPGFRYRTVLSDGATRVESEYNSQHVLRAREMKVKTPSGERIVQAHAFGYPGTEDDGVPDPADLPGNWSRPATTAITMSDLNGRSRTIEESFEFDQQGRVVSRTQVDGTVQTTSYDDEVPPGRDLPIGLPLLETTRTPDGLVREQTSELNTERTAVIGRTVLEGRAGEALTETSRVEFDVDAEGFVTEQRDYAVLDADVGSAAPRVTRWSRVIDAGAGTVTVSETSAVGTAREVSTTGVASLLHGGARKFIDEVGRVSQTSFDELGRPELALDPAGRPTARRYETAQQHGRNATIVTAPDRRSTTEVRDAIGRVTQLEDNLRAGRPSEGHVRRSETRAYPEPGVEQVTDAWGATTTTRRDVLGRVVEATGPTGLVQISEYDDAANTVTRAFTPSGDIADAELVNTEQFDVKGRSVAGAGTRADGRPAPATGTTFDGFDRAVRTETDRVSTTVEHDALGNPALTTLTPSAADATGSREVRMTRQFDGFGTSVEKTMSDELHSRSGGARGTDELGRTATSTDVLGRMGTTEYTPDGLPARIVAPNGQRTEHVYDPDTRELTGVEITSPTGAAVSSEYDYDPATGHLRAVFDPADRAGTELRYEWDGFGNLLALTYPDGEQIRHEYDDHGRKTRTTDIAENVTALVHDAAGLLTEATQRSSSGALLARVSYTYDAFGRMTALARDNDLTTEYTYTSASEVETERTTTAAGELRTLREYTYDVSGNLVERVDTTGGAETTATTTTYAYDAHDRLIRSAIHDGASSDAPETSRTEYELTVSGDIASETVTTGLGTAAESTNVRRFEYTDLGELAAVTSTRTSTSAGAGIDGLDVPPVETIVEVNAYDAAGNLTRAGDGTTYAYDAANRQTTRTSTDGTVVATEYWADGTRRSQRSGQARTEFYWDDVALINDAHTGADPAGSGIAAYLVGAARHARTTMPAGEPAVTAYYGTDRHGTITDLSDEHGDQSVAYAYSDYGRRLDAGDPGCSPLGRLSCNAFGYAGEYADPDGTLHLRTRSYDPVSMRFTTMDTAELHNTYAYADLNPIMKVDPSGRTAVGDFSTTMGTIGFGLLGFALTALSFLIAPPTGPFLAAAFGGVLLDVAAMVLPLVKSSMPKLTETENEMYTYATVAAGLAGFLLGAVTFTRSAVDAMFGKRITLPGWAKQIDGYLQERKAMQSAVNEQWEAIAKLGSSASDAERSAVRDIAYMRSGFEQLNELERTMPTALKSPKIQQGLKWVRLDDSTEIAGWLERFERFASRTDGAIAMSRNAMNEVMKDSTKTAEFGALAKTIGKMDRSRVKNSPFSPLDPKGKPVEVAQASEQNVVHHDPEHSIQSGLNELSGPKRF